MPSSVPRSLLTSLVCVGALLLLAPRAEAEPGIRILNSLTREELAFNALTTNREALRALTTGPLSTTAFATDTRLKRQLEDPSARRVMEYLAHCALPSGAAVQWTDRFGASYSFPGGMGLCPEWAGGSPSAECLGYATACLLARNNAYGRPVWLSVRGEDPRDARRFNPSGLPEEWSPMFLPCGAAGGWGLTAECGWQGDGWGTCTAGTSVTVAAGAPGPGCTAPPQGAIHGDRVLRVCREPQGCTWANRLADADRNPCGGIAPSVTFTCPANGMYSVMSAPYNRSARPGSYVRVAASSGTYPAAGFGAYTFREGAFYGNLFDPDALGVEVYLDASFKRMLSQPGFQGDIYQNAHACHGKDWVQGAARMYSRLCANATLSNGSAHGCLAKPAGPCEPGSLDTSRTPRCAINDGLVVKGDGDFESCKDAAGFSHPEPITVFLRSPCDALPQAEQQVCFNDCSALTHCTLKCRPKSPGECLQSDACVKDPAYCAAL